MSSWRAWAAGLPSWRWPRTAWAPISYPSGSDDGRARFGLDNASSHVARAFRGRRRQLAKIGVDLFYLPPRNPALNDIELVWRQAKYQDYPQRAQTSIDAIGESVDRAMTRHGDRIRQPAT